MPNGKVHRTVGVIAGGIAAGINAKDCVPDDRALEILGGAIGGYAGGAAPDTFEPATWPGHRKTAHAFVPVTVGSIATVRELADVQDFLREKAAEYRQAAQVAETEGARVGNEALAALLLILNGAFVGATWGYVSHCAMDAFSPKSIPFI